METLLKELASGIPDGTEIIRALVRLAFAAILGGIVGIQRESAGKPAGVRTHMIVAMGACLFIISSIEYGMSRTELSRVIQGLAAGIGFIGAGAILKRTEEHEVEGITTASGIWMTAAVGVGVGLGSWFIAAIGAVLTLAILSLLGQYTHKSHGESGEHLGS